MDPLARLGFGESLESLILGALLVVARVGPILYLVPVFGGRTAPPTLRVALAVLVAAVIFPSLALPDMPNALIYGVLVLKEGLVGAAIAFLTLLVFYALEMAGRLIDMLRGATLAEALVPGTEERTSPLGDLKFQLGVVLFLIVGGHRLLFATLLDSYGWIPLTGTIGVGQAALEPFALGVARAVGLAVATALLIAAPAVIVLLATELSLGVLGRVAPQVSVYFIGMPLRAAIGLVAVLFALTLLLPELPGQFARALGAIGSLLRSLGP